MKLNTKKIIAREFLILLSALIVSLIILGIIYSLNSFRKSKITNLSKEIQNNYIKSESLKSQYESKKGTQIWFHNALYSFIYDFNHPTKIEKKQENIFSEYDLLPSRASNYAKNIKPINQKDGNLLEFDTSLNYFRKNKILDFDLEKNFPAFSKNFGFASLEKFKKYLGEYSINSNDILNHDKALGIDLFTSSLVKKRNDLKSSVISIYGQYLKSLKVFLILLFLLFPIRYIYYTVKWSTRILKQK